MLLNLNLTTWTRRMASHWFGQRRPQKMKRQLRTRIGNFETLERREMLTAYTVTTLNDIVSAVDGLTSLREAVIAANQNSGADTIQFASGLTGEVVLTGGQIQITDSVTITGNGAASTVIDGQLNSRLFSLTNNAVDVTFQALTLTRGYASGEGGAISSNVETMTSLNVWDCVVTGNGATSLGGAIYVYDFTDLDIRNSEFTWNSTTFDDSIGGAITAYNGGTLSLANSTFARNETFGERAHGGAIYWYSGTVTATGTTFSANYTYGADAYGGAIILEVGQLELNDSLLERNQTQGSEAHGGALYLTQNASALIHNGTQFLENMTLGEEADGGAIYGEQNVTVIDSVFAENSVEGAGSKGGAIAMGSGVLTVTRSVLRDNQANGPVDFLSSTYGGGVYMGQGTVTIDSSTLFHNSTTGYGGGIYQDAGRLNVINSTISGNSATTADYSWGGGISVYSAEVAIDSSTIVFNTVAGDFAAGGGVMMLLGTAQIQNSIIARNVATGAPDLSGGGVGAAPPQSDGSVPGAFMTMAFAQPLTVKNSLIGNNTGSSLTASATPDVNGNLIGTAASPINPLLQALAMNGGSTPTHAIGLNSPAWNRGSNLLAEALGLTLDQIGRARVAGGTIDMGAFEVQGPAILSLVRTPALPNPTTASSVSFDITFSEAVTGVTASQFSAVVTGATLAGNVTVAELNSSFYRVTIHDISGAGTVALKLLSDGQIVNTSDNTALANGFSLTSSETFTIEEEASLSVRHIVYGPGNSSPTTFDTVTFTVTFSAAVQNVAASQFSVVTTGGVTSNAPQLTGSGAVYTVTVSGIAGLGTLGLNFADDGTVVRISDGQVMTAPNFTGAVFEIVEGTQGAADLDVGGLRFHVVGGGTFTSLGDAQTASGQVQVGFTPGQGQSFTPLGELNGNVTVKTDNLSFSVTGAVKGIIGGTAYTLYTGGLSDISVADLLNAGFSKVGESLGVAGVSFSLGSIRFVNSPQPAIRLQGSLTLPLGIKVAVDEANYVQIDSNGISITGASFSLTNSFSVGGVEFSTDNLTAYYSSIGNVFRLTGAASVTVGETLSLTVNFSETGLVINDGEFSSIDVTVTGEFDVKGVKVSANELRFRYDGDTEKFSLSGTAAIEIEGFDAEFSVTFGSEETPTSEATPGIVITDGELDSLDMAVNGEFKVSKVTISADDLRITYTENSFTMSGGATVKVEGLGDLSVAFGDADTPGMVVEDGVLQRLSMTINAEFEVSKVKVFAKDLTFTYERTPSGAANFSLAGTAGVSVEGIKGGDDGNAFSVTFGYQGAPGIVVNNGELKSLDITINATFEVSKVSIKAENVRFTYDADSNSFTLGGSASIKVAGMEGTGQDLGIGIAFGYKGAPGIVIENGELKKLDVTVNGSFKVAKVKIVVKDLRFTYAETATGYSFSMGGKATVDFPSAGFDIEFGNGIDLPGIVINDGRLDRLDVAVGIGFTIKGVRIDVQNVRFTYIRGVNGGPDTFGLSGGVTVSPASARDALAVSASFGDANNPGIVINSDGVLESLYFKVSRSINVKAISVYGELGIRYTQATGTFAVFGTAKIAVAYLGELNVNLGSNGTGGLVFDKDGIRSFDMTVTANFGLAGVTLTGNLVLTYSKFTGEFVATGVVSLNIGGIGNVTGTLGGNNGTRGLVINNGGLQSLDMVANANFAVGPLSLTGSLKLSYSKFTGKFVMYGSANGQFLGQSFFTVDMGNEYVPGVQIYNGRLQWLNITLRGNFAIQGVSLGNVNLSAFYDSYSQKFNFQGNAQLTLPSFIPDWLASVLGGRTLASIGVELNVIANNSSQSYLQAVMTIGGTQFGFRKQFDGGLTLIGANPASVAKSVWNAFISLFGPLENATVYYDPNFDFDLLNDPQTVTGSDGRFTNIVPQDAVNGQLVVVGGVDRSTGITNPLRLTAPYQSQIVSPLTSLVNQVMQQAGLSVSDALTVVNQSLGIPLTTDLLGQTLALEAVGGDAAAARSFSREVAVGTVVHAICSLLSSQPGAPSIAELSTNGFAAIVAKLVETGGAPLDLSDTDVILDLIERTAAAAGLSVDADLASGAAQVLAGVMQRIDDIPMDSTRSYLNRLLQIQTVTQSSIAPDLARLSAGEVNLTNFVNNHTGAALTSAIDAATFGPLNVVGPTVIITPLVSQSAGVGQPGTFDFQVFLSSPTPSLVPVTVQYATRGLEHTTAGVDFEATTGTLTWQPGDLAPKTISIPVFATNSELNHRTFAVDLSNVQNAELANNYGVGHIHSTYFATATAISSNDTTADYGQELTFTAQVSYLDPDLTMPTDGTVSFYAGDLLLGSSAVEAGVATYVTSTLPAGVHLVRAVYSGVLLGVEKYLPSESVSATQSVAQMGQSITFPAIADVTLGDAPLFLNAFTSSGLPINYRVVSGPASLNGEVLSFVGPGTVVVEADQDGDGNYQSATPISRTFAVMDSGTGSNNTAPVAVSGTAQVNPGETVSGQLLATDADDDALTFEIAIDPEHGTVLINPDGSYEYTADPDYEGFDSFTFFAIDGSLSSNPGVITITIGDPNLPPVVNSATLSVAENSAGGTTVGTVTASDPNPGQLKTFSIIGGNTDGTFAINPSSGLITVANPALLDFETTPSFSLQIEVVDDGDPTQSATGTITINLTDKNEAPVVIPAIFTLNENSALNTQVGVVDASDPDANQTRTFSILGGNTGNAFAIDPATGAIRVASPSALNFELTELFELLIKVADNGTPSESGEATITIHLNNVNEAPVVQPVTLSIAENSADGTAVGATSATDVDRSQVRYFSLVEGNTSGAFAIDPISGAITVANSAALNFEATPTFHLTVQATDDGIPAQSGTATVTINLTNVADEPSLANGSGTVTYLKKRSPIAVMPDVTVQGFGSSTSLGKLVISVFVPKKGQLSDYSFGNPGSLGTVATSGASDFRKAGGTHTITITLNEGVTDLQVQNYLRSITFSSKKMDSTKRPLGRKIDVQVFDREGTGTPSNVLTTQIRAVKKG